MSGKTTMEETVIEWRAPEFDYREKGIGWYWGSIIIAVAALGVAVWQKNFLFGVFIVIAEILVLVWANRPPATRTFRLTDRELAVDDHTRYLMSDLQSFSVHEDGGDFPTLILVSAHRLRPAIKIKVAKDRLPAVEELLQTKAPRVAWENSFIDNLERFFDF
jgi:hypothetical protein